MIVSKSIPIRIVPQNIKRYSKKYPNINVNDIINIDIKDLPLGSHEKIIVVCDECNTKKEVYYFSYNKIIKKHNKYICIKCSDIERKKTCLEKYGVEHTLSVKKIRDVIKNTMNDKYGVDYPAQNKEILNKIQNTNLERYEVKYLPQNKEILNKIQSTNLERYGNVSSFGNKEVREKSKKTMNIRYGVDYISQNKDLQKICVEKSKKTKIKNIIKNNIEIIDVDYDKMEYKCYCEICKKYYFVDTHLFNYRKNVYKTELCTFCNKIGKKYSNLEKKLLDFIKENYIGELIINNRSIISPYELDIYLPELKLAFEFNGLYWHNEINKPNDYHKIKTDLCLEKEIQLIHIYEDDWNIKQDIIKSMVLNKLHKIKNNISIEKTIIKEVDDRTNENFLNENHIQGYINSSIKIGLFYNDELVSLMTFKKLKNNKYELLRFCNKLNINIIGTESKLFKHFLNNYNPIEIIFYIDRSYNTKNLYEELGFKLNYITEPTYFYIINNMRKCQSNFNELPTILKI